MRRIPVEALHSVIIQKLYSSEIKKSVSYLLKYKIKWAIKEPVVTQITGWVGDHIFISLHGAIYD